MVEPAGSVLIGYSPNDFLMTNFTVAPDSCPSNDSTFEQSNQYDIKSTIKSTITGITLTNDGTVYICDNKGNIYQGDTDGHIGVWKTHYDNFLDTATPANSYSLPVNFTGITTNGGITALCSTTPSGPSGKTMQTGGYCYYFTEKNPVLIQINGLYEWNAIAIASDNYLYAQCETIYYSEFKDEYFTTLTQIMISSTTVASTPNTIFTKDTHLYYINSGTSYDISHNDANTFTTGNASYDTGSTNFCVNNDKVYYLKSGNIDLSGTPIQIGSSQINCDYFSVNTVKDKESIVAYKYTSVNGSTPASANITLYVKGVDYCKKINPQITDNTHLKDEILATTYKGLKGDANYADANKMYNLEFANRIHLGVGIAITAMSIFYLSRINI